MLSGRELGLSSPVPAATWGLIGYVNGLSRVMEGVATSGWRLISPAQGWGLGIEFIEFVELVEFVEFIETRDTLEMR